MYIYSTHIIYMNLYIVVHLEIGCLRSQLYCDLRYIYT